MQTSKALDRHKTKVGKQRKEADRMLREALRYDEWNPSMSDKVAMWDALMQAARDFYGKEIPL